ncbi:MAG: hypothetical protein ACKOSS_05325 [Planctomycetia bacterium]
MSEATPAAARARAWRWAALLLCALGAGCGGEAPAPAPQAPARWKVEPVAPAAKARYALERIVRGPVAQEHLPLPDDHAWVLASAQRDLLALPAETLALLDDAALVQQLTGPGREDLNPWHNLLQVLPALPGAEAGLVRRWTEPALAREEPGLWQLAVGCLVGRPDPELAPLLQAFLERAPGERRVSRECVRALLARPAPWPMRCVEQVLAHGSPEAWLACGEGAGGLDEATGVLPPAVADALAWWALLAEQAGPRPATGAPRLKTLPCTEAAAEAHGPPERRAAEVGDGRGWLAADPATCAVQPLLALFTTGLEPATRATCELARQRLPGPRAAIEAARGCRDPLRRLQAEHCMLEAGADLPVAQRVEQTLAFLARARDPAAPPLTLALVSEAVGKLPPGDDPAGEACLLRVVREAEPLADLMLLVEGAHARLLAAERGADEALVLGLLGSTEPARRGLGLHLAQRARKALFLPAVRALAGRGDPALERSVQRALFLLVAAPGAPAAERARYVDELVARIEAGPDSSLVTEAPGLLVLPPEGPAALARSLQQSPRAALYARSLRKVDGVLPRAVAEALADRLGPQLAPGVRYDICVALWRNAPAEAAPALAAARARLAPADRPAVDVVLEAVRHRAAFLHE